MIAPDGQTYYQFNVIESNILDTSLELLGIVPLRKVPGVGEIIVLFWVDGSEARRVRVQGVDLINMELRVMKHESLAKDVR